MKTEKLRVWWCSCVPIVKEFVEYYEVKNLQEAIDKIEELTKRDLDNKDITDNCGGLEVLNYSCSEWESEDGEGIFEYIENLKGGLK